MNGLLLSVLFAASAVAAKPPVKVIFDTDMLTDFDDVGALACLHALADAGECEILATVSCTRGNASVAAVEVINGYYGRPDIPVGCAKGIGVSGGGPNCDAKKPLAEGSHAKYVKLAKDYPQWVKHANSDDAPDANLVYRRALAAASDKSVVVCSIGFLTNLRRLLETKPDDVSPLDGRALVAKKVKKWVAMACSYPSGKEYNSRWDWESSKIALENWPTPVVFSDFQYGWDVYAGRAIAEQPGPRNPVKDVFKDNIPSREAIAKDAGRYLAEAFGMGGRSAWDETAVLAAVRGEESYFNVHRGEYRMVGTAGEDRWIPDEVNGRHLRLTEKTSKTEVGRIIDELICRGRAASCSVPAGETEPERHLIWPTGKIPDSGHPEPYEPYYMWWDVTNRTTDAIMICCSGGGYWGCSTGQFETVPLIRYLNAKGVTCVEFRYRPRPDKDRYPKHLAAWQDAQRLIRIVRHEARNRGWDTERIGFSGGSAGGHLTIMTAVSSTSNSYARVDAIDDEPCHVNFAVPVYPAYGMSDNPDGCSRKYDVATELVPEFLFDNKTPPMCFFHGFDDGWTPLTSWRCWFRMRQIGIPCELHMLANEGHCFQYRPRPGTNAEQWKDILWAWLTRMEFVTKHPYQYYARNMVFEGRAWEYPMRGELKNVCENYREKSWRGDGMCGAFYPLVDNVDLVMKAPVKGDCEFDFEFEIYGDAPYAAVGFGGWEVRFPAVEFRKATPQRVTLWKRGGKLTGLVNSRPVPSDWIRRAADVPEDRIVYRGKNGAGYGKFHMVRTRRFTDSLYGFGELPATTPVRWWNGPEKADWEKHPNYLAHLKKMSSITNGVTKTVFLGDSITANWSALPVANAVNLGYGGNQTSHVLWRITEGKELDGYEAERVVLLIGTNNTGHNPIYKEYPADTASGIREILRLVREKQPKAKIVLCAILPRGEKPDDPLRVRNEKVNEIIRGFADGRDVLWCDARADLLEPDGTLSRKICPDLLHPGAEGYSRIAAKLLPLINK